MALAFFPSRRRNDDVHFDLVNIAVRCASASLDDSLIFRLLPPGSYERDRLSPISDEKLHEEKSASIGELVGVNDAVAMGVNRSGTYPESDENARDVGGGPEFVDDSDTSANGVSANSSSSELLDESSM